MTKNTSLSKQKLASAAKPALSLLRLDIGAGQNKKEGFTGVDRWEGSDIVCDLNQPWEFAPDESVEEIFCSHTIEHVDIMHVMNEAYRVLKFGGRMEVIAPYYSSVRCWQDPTHINAISEFTFLYYNRQWREANGLSHYPITADFDFGYAHAFTPEWQNRHDDARRWALTHYVNVVTDIQVTLTKTERK